MSLARLVYYSAIVAGWAAFIGWMLAESLSFADPNTATGLVWITAIVGAAIGAGVSLVGGLTNGQWKSMLTRASIGLVGGAIGAVSGGWIGNLLFEKFDWYRWTGWIVLGIGIGMVDGIYEKSPSKIRNGLIGGALGGCLGGMLFELLFKLAASQSGMSGRAIGFVVLGILIGALIGLTQLVLRDAWLTVLDGYRSGRQLILSQSVVTLGRGEHLPLPFLGASNQELEKEHVRITRQANGTFQVEDLNTKVGTRLNKQPLQAPTVLHDGDVIKFGGNFVRYNERGRKQGEGQATESAPAVSKPIKAPPPPPPGKAGAAASKPPNAARPTVAPQGLPSAPPSKQAPTKQPPPPPPIKRPN